MKTELPEGYIGGMMMIKYDLDALEYISKLCDGHLRDELQVWINV